MFICWFVPDELILAIVRFRSRYGVNRRPAGSTETEGKKSGFLRMYPWGQLQDWWFASCAWLQCCVPSSISMKRSRRSSHQGMCAEAPGRTPLCPNKKNQKKNPLSYYQKDIFSVWSVWIPQYMCLTSLQPVPIFHYFSPSLIFRVFSRISEPQRS